MFEPAGDEPSILADSPRNLDLPALGGALGTFTSDYAHCDALALAAGEFMRILAAESCRESDPAEQRGNLEQRWFFFGIVSATWLSWQPMSILGILLAEGIPGHWGHDFAAILALIAITAPMFAGLPAIAGCLTAGAVSVAAAALPLKLGLLLAVVAGVAVAMALDTQGESHPKGHAR